MTKHVRARWLVPCLTMSLMAACGEETDGCPTELGVPIDVVVAPKGLAVDSVVVNAEGGLSQRCVASGRGAAGGSTHFRCAEVVGVKYRIEVKSGTHLWTKSVTLNAGDCGAADRAEVRFELDPATAVEYFETVPCTDILLLPIQVNIEPNGLPVDSVTSHNGGKETRDCQPGFRTRTKFSCVEQGAGTYNVQVTSGDYTWTQSVELRSNGCHVIELVELHFELDPETAD